MKKRYFKNIEGNMSIVFAVCLTMIVGGVGAAIDYSGMASQRVKYQSLADSAVLAAAVSGKTKKKQLQKIANKFVKENNFTDSKVKAELRFVEEGRIEVKVSGTYDTVLMGMFGKPNVKVDAAAESMIGVNTYTNIALVLDVTGSMNSNGRLSNMQTAASDMITKLQGHESEKVKMSLVPFANYVNVGVSHGSASWIDVPADWSDNSQGSTVQHSWKGCVGSRLDPWHKNVEYVTGKKIPAVFNSGVGVADVNCPEPLHGMTDDLNAIKTKVNALTANGSTYLPSGLMWGWRTLDSSAPLASSSTAPAGHNERNIMVMMTDGENTVSKSGERHSNPGNGDANVVTKAICDKLKSADIEVYTITFEVKDAQAKNLVSNCATSPSYYYNAKNGKQLAEAFQDIAESLQSPRLTR